MSFIPWCKVKRPPPSTPSKAKPRALREGVSLALSGGGFRATLFHLGALWRLNELGYLPHLKRITSVSGGSIINGLLATRWNQLEFDDQGIARNFDTVVEKPVREFCNRRLDIPVGLLAFLTWPTVILAPLGWNLTPGQVLAWYYNRKLFKNARLRDLPSDDKGPRFIFYATSYQTGVGVRISRPYTGDWRLGLLRDPRIKIATAVAASSAFPPVFAPLRLRTRLKDWDPDTVAPLSGENHLQKRMYLGDGGIYDNLGEEAARRYQTVLVSDAGAPFSFQGCGCLYHLSHVLRISRVREVAMEQTRALRTQRLVGEFKKNERKGTYWGLATAIDHYELEENGHPPPLVHDNQLTATLQDVSTRLWPFAASTQGHLINWGYALTDAAMRRHVLDEAVESGVWPVPEYPLSKG